MSNPDAIRLPGLDARLSCIAAQVPACELAADIGADHGKLACSLLVSGRVKRMIVSDISKVSRDKARDLFIEHGLEDRVEIRGEDGLYALSGQPGAVIIAGMGGGLIQGILSQPVRLRPARLIVSAHTELPLVRQAILDKSYRIEKELLVMSSGRYYRVMVARPGAQKLSESELALGYKLEGAMGARPVDYFRWQLEIARSWAGDKGEKYRKMVKEALDELA